MTLWYGENFQGLVRLEFKVKRTLFSGQSDYQKVDVFETEPFGRTLAIDDVFMTSERDEFFYHEMLVHPTMVLAPDIERVLIIGGGDGGTAREVLRYAGVKRCLMVEIDGLVVEVSKQYLPTIGTAWDDPRFELRVDDGIKYLKDTDDEPYDVIFLDGTDPIGPAVGLFNEDFYKSVKRMLKPGGIFALQSETPMLMERVFKETQETLKKVFDSVHPYVGVVPIYGCGVWSWTIAGNAIDPGRINPARMEEIKAGCKVYGPGRHAGAFELPGYVRELLEK